VQGPTVGGVQVLIVISLFLLCGSICAAPVTMSGVVTNAQTGLPVPGIAIGATRVAALGSGAPGDEIPVEVYGSTTSESVFSYTIDDSTPGLDRVLLFMMSTSYENEIYNNVTYSGDRPTYADVERPGVVEPVPWLRGRCAGLPGHV